MGSVERLIWQQDLFAFSFKDRRQALVTVAGVIVDKDLVRPAKGSVNKS